MAFFRYMCSHIPIFYLLWMSYAFKHIVNRHHETYISICLICSFLVLAFLTVLFVLALHNMRHLSYNLESVSDDLSDITRFITLSGVSYYLLLFLVSQIPLWGIFLDVAIIMLGFTVMENVTMMAIAPVLVLFGGNSWHLYVQDANAENAEDVVTALITKGTIESGDLVRVYVSEEIVAFASKESR